MKLAIIPARGGSKRIPGKNIRPFCGRPIIEYSIEAAQKAGLFDRIIVSTDDEGIMTAARKAGAEVPFVRPPEFSGDFTGTAEVLLHALTMLPERESIRHFCCIYATAPFMRGEDIRHGAEMIERTGAGAVFPVTSFPSPIFRSLKIGDDGRLSMFWPEHMKTRSNDLPQAYHDAGQFYWLDRAVFERDRIIYATDTRPMVIPRHLVNDIDTDEDWHRAELMFKALQQG